MVTPAHLLYRSGPVDIYYKAIKIFNSFVYYSEIYSLFCGSGHTVTSSLLTLFVSLHCRGGPKNRIYASGSDVISFCIYASRFLPPSCR